ncbi:hypothetical protein H3C66_01680 [Patescibacteria group bacterium]|nr:hypothetical protein [Patescibacteria group bacterium]
MTRLEINRPTTDESEVVGQRSTEIQPENPNIGALGSAGYQQDSLRVKGFCAEIIHDADVYLHHLATRVLPVLTDNPTATRIIDRAIMKRGLTVPTEGLSVPLQREVVVPLGGEWEGYDWVMTGAHMPGRRLSEGTKTALVDLANQAAQLSYEAPKALPPGFSMERITAENVTLTDLETLAAIFGAAFKTYISPLSTPADVQAWVSSEGIFPVVVRNERGRIVAIANGDMGEIMISGKPFKFLEIGDSAADTQYQMLGLNRNIKHHIIGQAIGMGFHSVHTETRAAWGSPNFGNAKNGMDYRGTLFLNCMISGEEEVAETQDPEIDESSRVMGSLNVWAMTEANPHWKRYTEN